MAMARRYGSPPLRLGSASKQLGGGGEGEEEEDLYVQDAVQEA